MDAEDSHVARTVARGLLDASDGHRAPGAGDPVTATAAPTGVRPGRHNRWPVPRRAYGVPFLVRPSPPAAIPSRTFPFQNGGGMRCGMWPLEAQREAVLRRRARRSTWPTAVSARAARSGSPRPSTSCPESGRGARRGVPANARASEALYAARSAPAVRARPVAQVAAMGAALSTRAASAPAGSQGCGPGAPDPA